MAPWKPVQAGPTILSFPLEYTNENVKHRDTVFICLNKSTGKTCTSLFLYGNPQPTTKDGERNLDSFMQ